MSGNDWAEIYARMDARIALKYEQLPKGEQVRQRPAALAPDAKKS